MDIDNITENICYNKGYLIFTTSDSMAIIFKKNGN